MNTLPEDNSSSKKTVGLGRLLATDAAKQIALVVVAALLLLSILWIWKSIEIRNILKKDAAERQQIKEQAISQIQQSHENHLKLLAKPFVWAVRNEMLSGKFSQVKLYVNDMISEQNVQKITITNATGLVILSTNKKDQGKEFAAIGDPVYILANTTIVNSINDSTIVMGSPVMGFNSRLGTLIITYSFHPPVFN
ncbi:MAG: hypothetical protein ABIQ31_16910 [Ferruginibacter sp.]